MLIFLDTEFTNLTDRKLISIGMVSEDGQLTFYRKLQDFDLDNCSPFVRANVLPLLGRFHDAAVETAKLSEDVRQWLHTLPRSLTIACDSDWDLELFGEIVGSPLPAKTSLADLICVRSLTQPFSTRPCVATTMVAIHPGITLGMMRTPID